MEGYIHLALLLLTIVVIVINISHNKLKYSVEETRRELETLILERERLLNIRVDGEIDRLDKLRLEFSLITHKIKDEFEHKLDKREIQALESEVDRLSHLISEIEVSLQNEINKAK